MGTVDHPRLASAQRDGSVEVSNTFVSEVQFRRYCIAYGTSCRDIDVDIEVDARRDELDIAIVAVMIADDANDLRAQLYHEG